MNNAFDDWNVLELKDEHDEVKLLTGVPLGFEEEYKQTVSDELLSALAIYTETGSNLHKKLKALTENSKNREKELRIIIEPGKEIHCDGWDNSDDPLQIYEYWDAVLVSRIIEDTVDVELILKTKYVLHLTNPRNVVL